MNDNEEIYQFKDNDQNKLAKLSLNKKIAYIGYIILIIIVISVALYTGNFIFPNRHNEDNPYIIKGIPLYIFALSGFTFVVHFLVQILNNYTDDENLNNYYFKFAYNSRVLAFIFLIISFICALFCDSQNQLLYQLLFGNR